MPPIRARVTVTLPPDQQGRTAPVGSVIWVDPDDQGVATALSVGHLTPVGPIPQLVPDPSDDDGS